jgi:hypothetical protein
MTRTEPYPTQAPVAVQAPAASPQAPPPASATPSIAPAPVVGQADAMPPGGFTQAYVNALNAKKSELSNQLRSAQSRRNDVAREYRNAPEGPARTGLEARLSVLDGRLAQLETEIAANGRALAAAPGNMLANLTTSAGSGTPFVDNRVGPFSSGQLTAVTIVFTIFVMMPMALAAARAWMKRADRPRPTPQILESSARLERMEQAVDAIAVEVERISEGQRFVTGLLAKRTEMEPLLAGQGEPSLMAAGQSPASARDSR